MKKEYLEIIKQTDSGNLALEIGNMLRNLYEGKEFHLRVIVIAYASYLKKKKDKTKYLTDEIQSILMRYAENCEDLIDLITDSYSEKEILSFILYNETIDKSNRFFVPETTTPRCLSKLVCKILNIQDNENVLELCSGQGSFATELYYYNQMVKYKGVELNYVARTIAILRLSLLGLDGSVELKDAFEYEYEVKAEKLFSNYPFRIKMFSMKEYSEEAAKYFSIPKEVIFKSSSDWLFNTLLLKQMSDNGKAIAIMTNGSTWNKAEKCIRKFFVENGYIEAIISLPDKMFYNTNIPTTMVVFSKNNKKVRMIDAQKIYIANRKNNVFSDENIEQILSLFTIDSKLSSSIDINKIAENDYNLNAMRYLEVTPKIKDGVEFGSIVKSITRGAQLKAGELDKIKSNLPTNYQYLMLANIDEGIISINENDQYLKMIPENIKKYCIKDKSLVLTKIGVPNFKSAVAQVDKENTILANGNVYVIEIDELKADPYYIQAFFSSNVGTSILESMYRGSNTHTISLESLRKMIVPLPDLEKQKIIGRKYAAILDELILLRRKEEKISMSLRLVYEEV